MKKICRSRSGQGARCGNGIVCKHRPEGGQSQGVLLGESGTAPIYVYKMQYTKARTFALCRVPPVTHIWLFFSPAIWCMIKRNGPDGAG